MNTTHSNTRSLSLALLPAFFAAGCCATAPLMLIFGFSAFEFQFEAYRWLIRGGGLILLFLSLWWYFRRHGIISWSDYRVNIGLVLLICIQTFVYTLLIYAFLVYVAVPYIWHDILNQISNCCIL